MKVAIVCDWLVTYAGAERVLEQILKIYPKADIFCIVDFIEENSRNFILNKKTTKSFIQKMPWSKDKYKAYLPLMPLAIEQLDVSGYDIIISSSHAVAKGIITGPDQIHISYVHSPIRYAWDLQHQYLNESGIKGIKSILIRLILHYIRCWDYRTSNGVDFFIANSNFIARRIKKVYGRESKVIYPPVNINIFLPKYDKDEFYLTVSRLVPYKKVKLIVEAFNEMPEKKLIVIGNGPEYEKIKKTAKFNIEILGYKNTDIILDYMQRAKAFIFAAEEDFGITPVEAQACGTPVIAFAKGGALETIVGLDNKNPTGVFFYEQSVDSLINAINLFEKNKLMIDGQKCRENAERFSIDRFKDEFVEYVSCISNGYIR